MKEFKAFVLRGNVIDLAVGVVIGAAFGAIVTSFVKDVLTPLLGLVSLPDFTQATIGVGDADIRYGLFVNAVISFLMIAAAVFFGVIKPVNRLMERSRSDEVAEAPSTRECPHCLSEIPVGAARCAFCTQTVRKAA